MSCIPLKLDTLVAMVAAGAGVTLLPEMARSHFRYSGVKLIELAEPRPRRTIGLACSEDKYSTPAVRAIVKQMKDSCSP